MKNSFSSDREFVEKIENFLPRKSAVFVLPIYGFPEANGDSYNSLVGYLHSKNLRWSYPAMAGRSASAWQETVWKRSFEDFVGELKKEKFAGIFIDRQQFAEQKSWKELRRIESNLKSISTASAIVSQDLKLVFYRF
jgi:phosphoglycerol transferase